MDILSPYIYKILSFSETAPSGNHYVPVTAMGASVVKIENLVKRYKELIAVDHINLISCSFRIFSQILNIIVKNPEYGISGIQIVI